jgi:four helix bundle protein
MIDFRSTPSLKNNENIDLNKKNNQQKHYDLEKRTLKYSKDIIQFLKTIPKNIINIEILKQTIRSAGSVGANYIEANESLSKKDFLMHIKICRKEAKETVYWLNLLDINHPDNQKKCELLINESTQFVKIFSAIIEKSK